MEVNKTALDGVLVLTPARHRDDRGFLSEVFSTSALAKAGIDDTFVQENHLLSRQRGTIRGLHYQVHPSASKLVRVTRGSVFDVAVDLRQGSPTLGQHVGVELSAENWQQLYVPRGFAHGFCTLEANTEVVYKTSELWSPESDRGVAWDDPELAIQWPVQGTPVLSDKDKAQPRLGQAELPA